jgi:hypothetical protein
MQLMLLREIIPVYTENHTEPKDTKYGIADYKAAGTYSCYSAVRGQSLPLNLHGFFLLFTPNNNNS